ncbi:hypothetical protein Q7C36_017087 [Tachysurus vachellii]|uniref:Ig-like domain-containing protein n=1 Tax=Tachysurus vachellii TaxID=175792 RepID=A0AA88M2J7_TACVA|nr:hypothetical protein Q7C36_017087 [Tachysurus vachellii]
MTKTNKDIWHKTKTKLKIGDEINTTVSSVWLCVEHLHSGVSSDEIRLDQSPAVVKRPGETVKISCKINGYSMTSKYIHWIRQKPGKALEWLGRMDTGKNAPIYAESVKNQLTLTEDVSASTQYLEAKTLRTEDTAVYYCARQATVTGAEEAAVQKPDTHCN